MKSYTDLEQSKKLTEILPIESADCFWDYDEMQKFHRISWFEEGYNKDSQLRLNENNVCAWSLAALLAILTEQDFIIKTIGNEFNIDIPIRHCKIWFSSLLDAVFEMICWLKENNKL